MSNWNIVIPEEATSFTYSIQGFSPMIEYDFKKQIEKILWERIISGKDALKE